jgi:hypothetical protein
MAMVMAMMTGAGRDSKTDEGRSLQRSGLFFDPWLICDHPEIDGLVIQAVESYEARTAPGRLRKRREADREAFRALARAIVGNLAYALANDLEPPTVGIALARPTGKRSRYAASSTNNSIADVIDALSPALLAVTRSRRWGIASALTPGDALTAKVRSLAEFGPSWFTVIGGETVILRHKERDYASDTEDARNVEYEDTPETIRFRDEMARINEALASADLRFDGSATINTRNRRLRRNFVTPDGAVRFDLGGRLGGGWWSNLKRRERPGIRIDGRPVADLDFSAMFLRLAYARASLEPPTGDLYAGILPDGTGLEYREGVKRVVNAMLTRVGPMTRLPRDTKELLPGDITGRSIREAILKRHAPIKNQFERGAGLRLMRTESDILIAVMLRLLDGGTVALPMHDGLMVREDRADDARAAMREVSRELAGFALPIKMSLLAATAA